uniref:RRM domain-containing protein n=1 Tax=Ciona savignyi TaxID=51511 RepID=H2YG65_CIOSA
MSKIEVFQMKIVADKSCTTGHTLFLHDNYPNKKDDEYCILVTNIPPYCDEHCLHRLFEGCGKILSLKFTKQARKPKTTENTSKFFPSAPVEGFKMAYITYDCTEAVEKALKKSKLDEIHYLSSESTKLITGLRKWCLDYVRNQPDPVKMQMEIDEYMAEFDAKVKKEQEVELANEGIPDEEGWVKVTTRGRNPGVSRTEANQTRIRRKEKQKRKEKEMLSIYKYQVRESKREQIANLRKKFEEDKLKIKNLKESRKFRPF